MWRILNRQTCRTGRGTKRASTASRNSWQRWRRSAVKCRRFSTSGKTEKRAPKWTSRIWKALWRCSSRGRRWRNTWRRPRARVGLSELQILFSHHRILASKLNLLRLVVHHMLYPKCVIQHDNWARGWHCSNATYPRSLKLFMKPTTLMHTRLNSTAWVASPPL